MRAATARPTTRATARAALVVVLALTVGLVSAAPTAARAPGGGVRAGFGAPDPDPGALGPEAYDEQEYDLGDLAFQPDSFPGRVELKAKVYAPTTIAGRAPVVVIQHGRHATCANGDGDVALDWPCPVALPEIPSYQGYDALGRLLASHGIIAVSIGANGINAVDNYTRDGGASARGQLVLEHLRRWRQWDQAATGPFGSRFVGKVDLDRVGLMGHSRGGEGVVAAAQQNLGRGSPFGIDAVVTLGPVDFARRVLNGVPVQVVLPFCDGDVSDLQGAAYYDDSRHAVPGDETAKQTTLLYGANHNFFNTVWTTGPGSSDDAEYGFGGPSSGPDSCRPGQPGRLTGPQQAAAGATVMGGFLRRFVLADDTLQPFVTGVAPHPTSSGPARWSVAYHGGPRLDVARWSDGADFRTNRQGRPVVFRSTSAGVVCDPYSTTGQLPSGQNEVPGCPGAGDGNVANPTAVLDLGWTRPTASVRTDLPAAGLDVTAYDGLRFRVAFPADRRNDRRARQDLRVRLTDADGAQAAVAVGGLTNAVARRPASSVAHAVLNGVRVPLASFAGVDLTRVTSVELLADRTEGGRALLSDLAFTNEGTGSRIGPTAGAGDAAPILGPCRVSSAQRWACAVHQVVTGRQPLPDELALLTRAYATGTLRQRHIATLVNGPEGALPVVGRALLQFTEDGYSYDAYDFVVSQSGLGGWEAGITATARFAAYTSSETRFPEAQVDAAYVALLGRTADPAGMAHWEPVVAERGLTVLVAALLRTAERADRVVLDRFRQIVGRTPDAGARAYWVPLVRVGRGEQRLVIELLRSAEFIDLALR